MSMRGLLSGALMVVLGAMFAWMLGGALEMRAEKEQAASPTDLTTPSVDKHHWMF
jgi:hypothetical protein